MIVSRGPAETRPRWVRRQRSCLLRTKWTVQRCRGQQRIRSGRSVGALLVVAGTETHAVEAGGAQPARELEPERLCLGLAETDACTA